MKNEYLWHQDRKADARLIKAAPDLLAACKYVLDQAGLSINSPTYSKVWKAIKKAEGGIHDKENS